MREKKVKNNEKVLKLSRRFLKIDNNWFIEGSLLCLNNFLDDEIDADKKNLRHRKFIETEH